MMLKLQGAYVVNFLIYVGVLLPVLGLGIFLFFRTTPYHEYDLMSQGAKVEDPAKVYAAQAAAFDLGGKILGLSLVLASAVYHAVNPLDLLLWGVIGIVAQVGMFYLFEAVTPLKVVREIPAGNVSLGIFSAFISVATGLLLASLISY